MVVVKINKPCRWGDNCRNRLTSCVFVHPGDREYVGYAQQSSGNQTNKEPQSTVNTTPLNSTLKSLEEANKRHQQRILQADELINSVKIHNAPLKQLEFLLQQQEAYRAKKEELLSQKKQHDDAITEIMERLAEGDESQMMEYIEQVGRHAKYLDLHLPIYAKYSEILQTICSNQINVIVGATGSGKSTQIVQYIANSKDYRKRGGCIVCTQPRKVAAISLASRVAHEFGVKLGEEVGYHVGMQRQFSEKTRIKYVTDRILLNEIIADPTIPQYSYVVIDEAHERSIDTDILLGLVKHCTKKRPDIRVLVTSATIDERLFCKHFNCPLLIVSGRSFPVDIKYSEFEEAYVRHAARKAAEVHQRMLASGQKGDILVFLAGQDEIEFACEHIKTLLPSVSYEKAAVLPLHGKLPLELQQQVFEKINDKRKIIFATNTAETSITIDGITVVIDTGMCKENEFDAKKNMNVVKMNFITQSSAEQRAGRAGRTAPGTCYRLYSEDDFINMPKFRKPEIVRTHLGTTILKLKQLGITDILNFDFIERPNDDAITEAINDLYLLGAITSRTNGILTDLGKGMAVLPLDPLLSKMIFEGYRRGCKKHILDLVSMLSVADTVFWRGGDAKEKEQADIKKLEFCDPSGDLMTLLRVFNEYVRATEKGEWCFKHKINKRSLDTAISFRNELSYLIAHFEEELKPLLAFGDLQPGANLAEELTKSVLSSLFLNVCVSNGTSQSGYTVIRNAQNALIHPSSALVSLGELPPIVAFYRLVQTSQFFIRQVFAVKEEWIKEAAPPEYNAISDLEPMLYHQFTKLSSSLIQAVIGKRGATLRAKEAEMEAVIDCSVQDSRITMWCRRSKFETAKSSFQQFLEMKKKELLDETIEIPLHSSYPNATRVIIGRGGVIQHLLLPDEFISVNISNIPKGITPQILKLEFTMLAGQPKNIAIFEESNPVDGSLRRWGYADFATPEIAATLVNISNLSTVQLAPKGSIRTTGIAQQTAVNISWFEGRSCGKGTITVDEENQAAEIKEFLHGKLIQQQKIGCYFDPMKNTKLQGNKIVYCVRIIRIPLHFDEASFAAFINPWFPYLTKKNISFFRENANPADPTAEYQYFKSVLSQFGEVVSLSIVPYEHNKFRRKATAIFKTKQQADRAIKNLNGTTGVIGEGRLYMDRDASYRFVIKQSIYKCVKNSIAEMKNRIERDSRAVIHLPKDDSKSNFVNIRVTGDSSKEVSIAKREIETMLMGTTIKEDVDLIDGLFTQKGRKILEEIQQKEKVYIFLERKTNTVQVFGAPKNRSAAQALLSQFFAELKREVAFTKSLPRGGLKLLIGSDGLGISQIRDESQVRTLEIDFVRQTLTAKGDPGAIEKLQQLLNSKLEMSEGIQSVSHADSECCLCLSPVTEPFRLLCCGHPICRPCMKHQIFTSFKTNIIPMLCVGCSQPIVVRDLVSSLGYFDDLLLSSKRALVNKNPQAYFFCKTPDCIKVFRQDAITEETFFCEYCEETYCSKCKFKSHPGLPICPTTEEASDLTKLGIQQCPKCGYGIEKNEGCPHMQCLSCKAHFCWLCGSQFSSATECNTHINFLHNQEMW